MELLPLPLYSVFANAMNDLARRETPHISIAVQKPLEEYSHMFLKELSPVSASCTTHCMATEDRGVLLFALPATTNLSLEQRNFPSMAEMGRVHWDMLDSISMQVIS